MGSTFLCVSRTFASVGSFDVLVPLLRDTSGICCDARPRICVSTIWQGRLSSLNDTPCSAFAGSASDFSYTIAVFFAAAWVGDVSCFLAPALACSFPATECLIATITNLAMLHCDLAEGLSCMQFSGKGHHVCDVDEIVALPLVTALRLGTLILHRAALVTAMWRLRGQRGDSGFYRSLCILWVQHGEAACNRCSWKECRLKRCCLLITVVSMCCLFGASWGYLWVFS